MKLKSQTLDGSFISPLPSGWRWGKLGEECVTTSGGTPSRGNASYYHGTIPWVKSGELNDGLVSVTAEHVTMEGIVNSSAKVFPAGTLLVAMYGATVGKLGVLVMNAATNQAICGITVGESIHRDYLFYFLLNERDRLIHMSFGGAQPNISQDIIRNIMIPLATLDEQKRIAGVLSQKLAAVAAARAAAEAQLEAAKALTAAYLRTLFEGAEAQKWTTQTLHELCDIQLGKMLSQASKTGLSFAPYLRNANVQWNRFDLADVSEMDFSERERVKFELRRGDVLVCEGGEPGRAAVWNGQITPCYYQKALHRLRPINERVLPQFIMYRLWTGALRGEFSDEHAKTTIAHLPAIRLATLKMKVPPIEIQAKVVAELDQKVALVNQSVEALKSQIESINEMPALVLCDAFLGRL